MDLKIVKVSAITGLTTGCTIFLGSMLASINNSNYIFDWRDIAFIGSVGSVIGAHYSVTGNYLFRCLRYY